MKRDPHIDGQGWLMTATRLPSPTSKRVPATPRTTLIVVHNISLPPDDFITDSIARFFQNTLDYEAHPYFDHTLRGMRVSAHFVIRRSGEIEQFVSCNERAWHADISSFFGRERCNDFSIGIELEGRDNVPFDDAQYDALSALVRLLVKRYPIDALAGHSDVAPGRKTDLGWPRLRHESALPSSFFPFQPNTLSNI